MTSPTLWHDIEANACRDDLACWFDLVSKYSRPGELLCELGAGVGRVSLALASRGYRILAVDNDQQALAALRSRIPPGCDVDTICADARDLRGLPRTAGIIAPLMVVQLLGGDEGRRAMLASCRDRLFTGGWLAVALVSPLPSAVGKGQTPWANRRLALDGKWIDARFIDSTGCADHLDLVTARTDSSHAGSKTQVVRQRLDRLDPTRLMGELLDAGFTITESLKIAGSAQTAPSEVIVAHAA